MKYRPLARTLFPVCLALCAFTAQAEELGEATYLENCATCHGTTGDGDGPMAEALTVAVPALNTLSQQNGGSFPMLLVVQTIDGRSTTRAHGNPMPVWGAAFKVGAVAEGNPAADLAARGRILSLAYYLESIQK